MKKILVPVDFSDTSSNALLYAVQLFGTSDIEITVLNTYGVQSTAALFLDRDDDPRIYGRVTLVYNNVASPGGTAFVPCYDGICEYAYSNPIDDNREFYGKAAKSKVGKLYKELCFSRGIFIFKVRCPAD